jgi:hypothetical protein
MNTIETYDFDNIPNLGKSWKIMSIGLGRGEPNFTPFEKRSDIIRKQWLAFEAFLDLITLGKNLYILGSFNYHTDIEERIIVKKSKKEWTGSCLVKNKEEIHKVLCSNSTECFTYITCEAFLSEVSIKQLLQTLLIKKFFLNSCLISVKMYIVLLMKMKIELFLVFFLKKKTRILY